MGPANLFFCWCCCLLIFFVVYFLFFWFWLEAEKCGISVSPLQPFLGATVQPGPFYLGIYFASIGDSRQGCGFGDRHDRKCTAGRRDYVVLGDGSSSRGWF